MSSFLSDCLTSHPDIIPPIQNSRRFELIIDEQSFDLFVEADSLLLRRAIWGTLNPILQELDSDQTIDNANAVSVSLRKNREFVVIRIDHVTPNTNKNKEFVAEFLELSRRYKVQLDQSSNKNSTCLTVSFPYVPPPLWFADRLVLHPEANLLFLSNDDETFLYWKILLESYPNVILRQLKNVKEFSQAIKTANPEKLLALIDQRLPNNVNQSGLCLVENLGIAKHTVLMTDDGEESIVGEQAQSLGLKILPKFLLSRTPFMFGKRIHP